MNIFKKIVILHIISVIFYSCNSSRNLVYFSDLQNNEFYKTEINNDIKPRIQPNDLLAITVNSLNSESNTLFNRGNLQSSNSNTGNDNIINQGYLVDENGTITFPVIGKIKLAGLTREEALDKMTSEIRKNVKDPIVTLRFLNFKITVIGEVNKPATFTIPTERISTLEALGLAGDLTTYGKRENILLIREKDGSRSTTRLNLNDKNFLNSPYYYLQQNDVLYVEPDKLKQVQASTNTRSLTIASMGLSIIVALIFNFQNIF